MDKRSLTERDICTKFILPAIKCAGWDEMLQVREEVYFTKGRIIVRGKLVTRGKAKKADFVLYYKPNIPIALIEAKDNNHSVGDGMQQGLDYAATLDIPFVFSSNGDGFVFHDRTGQSPSIEMNRPDQIKRLRQTILNLAVRGKLVPQDARDEPASELLKRIAKAKAERKRKTGDARIKFEPDPAPDELDMLLPSGWAVQSFENLFLFIDYRGNTPPKTDNGIPLITAKNIRMGYLNREPREYISKATFKTWMTRGFPNIGDLFFTTEAPLANICLNDINEPFALAQRAICFQPYAKIDTRFLMFALMSDTMQSLINKHATGMTAKGIKAANLKPLPIPVPPIAEQHRIIAKVDELMALCDRLEASLTATAATRCRLLDALLAEALAPVDAREMEAAE